MIQTRYATKGQPRVARDKIDGHGRNPIRVISWAHKTPNLGGIARLSEAFLVEHLAAFKDPAPAPAVGTLRWQPHETTWDLAARANDARWDGYTLVALEQTDESVRLGSAPLPEKMCLLVGNEGSGLPQSVLDMADMAIEIEQFGVVGSLNVVTATAIALYEWSRQHRETAQSLWKAA